MPAKPRVDRIKTIYSAAKGLNFGFRMTGFPSAPGYNGISAYQPQLLRLTIRFCRQSESSAGVRNFIENSLVKFGMENPTCSVYVVPTRNNIPTLRGEYSNGRMVHLNAKNFSLEQVSQHINYLRTRSGQPIVKFEAAQTAQCNSVQGMWTPILWQDSRQNLAAGQLPKPEFSILRTKEISATEYVLSKIETQESD